MASEGNRGGYFDFKTKQKVSICFVFVPQRSTRNQNVILKRFFADFTKFFFFKKQSKIDDNWNCSAQEYIHIKFARTRTIMVTLNTGAFPEYSYRFNKLFTMVKYFWLYVDLL